ncbi:MAG: hypothetical protein AAGB14_02785 [Verrucomicrobiota bacterium]
MRTLLLLALTCLNLSAIPAGTTLTLVNDPIPGQPGKTYGVLDIEVSGPNVTTSNTQSTLSGTVDAAFDVDSGKTSELTLSNGMVTGTDFSASGTASVSFLTGPYILNATELAGTFETPAPPGIVTAATGEFDASQHRFTVNAGTVTGEALGQFIQVDYSPQNPFEGTGNGIGTVTLTPAGSSGIFDLFDVVVIVPNIVATDSIVVGSFVTTTVTVEATGSLKATGMLQVPKSEYLAWTLAENIPGADGCDDANHDGIPNAIAWGLGLGAFENAQPHVLRPANGGYEIQLPATGTAAAITVEGSDLMSAWLPIAANRLSTPANPLPPGSTGTISIGRVDGEFLRLSVSE